MCWRACMANSAADSLTDALAQFGLMCRVEERDGLAIVHPGAASDVQLADTGVRRQIVALARERGFTHVAVALGAGEG
jgi:hypothetical protein